jgi:hypothetical protein
MHDEAVALGSLPAHTAGAPMPLILASDACLVLSYETAPSGEHYAIVKFGRPRAHYFGPPNDEALHGHALAKRGLQPFGIYEIRNSSWIRDLEQMNKADHRQDTRCIEALRHFAFTFHDSLFECVAKDVMLAATLANSIETSKNLMAHMAGHLRQCLPFPIPR